METSLTVFVARLAVHGRRSALQTTRQIGLQACGKYGSLQGGNNKRHPFGCHIETEVEVTDDDFGRSQFKECHDTLAL